MNIPDGSDLIARCDRLVELATGRGADQVEAYWQSGASLELDIEAGKLAGSSLGGGQGGAVRLVVGGRLGFAYLTDESHAATAIERAIAQAKVGPGDQYSLPDGGRVEPLSGRWDDHHAALDVDAAQSCARDLIAGGKACPDGEVSGGGVGMGWGVEAIVNSNGVQAWDRSTSIGAGASMILKDGDSAINAWDSKSAHVGSLDGHAIGAHVAATVDSLRNPAPSKDGVMDVVLMPDAGAELVLGFIGSAIDGDDALRGRSVWSDKRGQSVGHPGLTILDDPQRAGAVGTSAMDGEGLATRAQGVIANGNLGLFTFDSWAGHRHGLPSSHHAARGDFKALPGVGIHHWVLEHETTQAMDALVGDVEDGYLVESVLGAHTANATTGDFSVTAPNVWRIEKGAVVGACKDIAIGGNLPAMLSRLDGVSDAPQQRDGSTVPAIRFRDVRVSV